MLEQTWRGRQMLSYQRAYGGGYDFCRFFRRNMGTTLTSYINSVRIMHVCKDLKDTDLTIGEILERHGVTNYKKFLLSFKQVYGCAPRDFRKQ